MLISYLDTVLETLLYSSETSSESIKVIEPPYVVVQQESIDDLEISITKSFYTWSIKELYSDMQITDKISLGMNISFIQYPTCDESNL